MENTGTMENLKLIENDLVPVYTTDTGEKVVYGTELHKALGVKSNYRDWAKNRLYDCDAVENMDFEAAKILAPSGQVPSAVMVIAMGPGLEVESPPISVIP